MDETENPRRIRIRFKGPAPNASPDGEHCAKPTLNACKSLKPNGIQTSSSDAKLVARSAEVPELSNKKTNLSSNTRMSSEQQVECGGGSMKLLSGFGKQKQFSVDTQCRLMRCNTATKGRKRSESSLGLPTSNQLKRSKRLSSTKRWPSLISNLPDFLLVEILCRLPCYRFVFQCKSVSKRWRTLITHPYFIGRFVNIQSCKKTPTIHTLINKNGEEFPPRIRSSSKLLTPVLRRTISCHSLIAEPIVVATYNDLVLWCARKDDQRDYYISNAYTMQWVALPPTPSRCQESPLMGLICDIPDFRCEKDVWKEHNFQRNADCRCTVVRILPPDESAEDETCDSFKLNVEIFSSETGDWRETVVSSPRPFNFAELDEFCFAYNGMLYWAGDELLFVGLGPFYSNKSSISSSSSYSDGTTDDELCLTVFEERQGKGFLARYLGMCRGFVRMCNFRPAHRKLYVWELKEEDHDLVNGAAGKLCLSKQSVYSLDPNMYPDNAKERELKAFDPNNQDILYLHVDGDIIKFNIHTREWSKMVEKCKVVGGYYFPVVLPWWPTPIPSGFGGVSRQAFFSSYCKGSLDPCIIVL